MAAVAIIVRAYDAEAPYIKSFLQYYAERGCEEFHIVVPLGNPYGILLKHCEGVGNLHFHIDSDDSSSLRGSQSIPLKYVKAKYILSVDVDEYLDVSDLSLAASHDYVRFHWAIIPFPKAFGCMSPGFYDGQYKYLIRTDLCAHLDDHNCQTISPVCIQDSQYTLFHYVYRSFNDMYLKCMLSNYGDYQSKGNGSLISGVKEIKDIPLKFKMAAIYNRLALASTTKFPNYCQIDDDLEQNMIESALSGREMADSELAFEHYQSRIDVPKFLRAVFKHKKYKEYGRLPHYLLSEISDKTLFDELHAEKWIQQKRRRC